MRSIERRTSITKLLNNINRPIKGVELANKFNVTRQVIVKDIAILRAEGNRIIATPDGYILNIENERVKSIVAVNHQSDRLNEELAIVIKYGGIIEDVIVEHPLYGEIKANLRIKTLNDLNKFIENFKDKNAKPLSVITNGVHLHTISTERESDIECIKKELKEKGFLLSEG